MGIKWRAERRGYSNYRGPAAALALLRARPRAVAPFSSAAWSSAYVGCWGGVQRSSLLKGGWRGWRGWRPRWQPRGRHGDATARLQGPQGLGQRGRLPGR